jgi:hypothetical protein
MIMFFPSNTPHIIVINFGLMQMMIMMMIQLFAFPVYCQILPVNSPTPFPTTRITYVHGIPIDEYDALETFYESLGGEDWTWQISSSASHWIFSPTANPCYDQWQGLTCDCVSNNDEEDCHIIAIDLQEYNLTGVISPAISNLTFLITLQLSYNHIIDPLPETLQNLTALSILSLAHNNLTIMSPVIYSCLHLTGLDLSYNQIADVISPEIGNLVKLIEIFLEFNHFFSSLPLEFYRNLTSLENIVLENNEFTGTIPAEIHFIQSLFEYGIGGNAFFGSIPEQFPFSSYLTYLSLGPNLFSQSLPSSFKKATLMNAVLLNSNSFTGPYTFLPLSPIIWIFRITSFQES